MVVKKAFLEPWFQLISARCREPQLIIFVQLPSEELLFLPLTRDFSQGLRAQTALPCPFTTLARSGLPAESGGIDPVGMRP